MVPLIGVVVFAAVGIVWRAWLQRRRFGHSGLVLFRSGRWPQHLREVLMVLLCAVMGSQVVTYAADPAALAPIALLALPQGGPWVLAGALALFGGIALMVAAQLDLGASWRVGIDEGARPGLVTTGLYRFSRNPIYLALSVVLVGYLVLLPTWLSLGALLVSWAGIRSAIGEEERYLRRAYGDEFTGYARSVGRFLPKLGSMREARRTTERSDAPAGG
jgi:protein-S-isoprenylcysteine O-methyltransferase Ste14